MKGLKVWWLHPHDLSFLSMSVVGAPLILASLARTPEDAVPYSCVRVLP